MGVLKTAKAEFLETARAAAVEVTAWRELLRMGHWKHQQTIKAIEAHTVTLRLFQGRLIPWLLQTPEYVTAVFSLPPELPSDSRRKTKPPAGSTDARRLTSVNCHIQTQPFRASQV